MVSNVRKHSQTYLGAAGGDTDERRAMALGGRAFRVRYAGGGRKRIEMEGRPVDER